ncbi:MAG TPA: hypothetical protein VNA29_02895 [Sphingomicrobium sp.]|nr:hypothetical protein [Sphingomicrobium sp.]
MTKWILAAGAAALAITAPALADPKGNKGGGNKEHAGHAMKADHGGKGNKASRGNGGKEHKVHFARNDDKDRVKAMKFDRDDDRKVAKFKHRGDDIRVKIKDRDDNDGRFARFDDDDDFRFVPRWSARGLASGFADGCPPGLVAIQGGCMPWGHAKRLVGTPLAAALMGQKLEGPYSLWYRDDDRYMYRWDDDHIYRVQRDGGLIDALFPFQNRDYYYYPVGANYPEAYNYYNVPHQYSSYYPDSSDMWYRYGDGAIYQVNPKSGLIQGIAALLTGNPLAVGQQLPMGYSAYNVPFDYRDRYYDSAEAMYRYNDGYIYRADPKTQLITAVIDAII